MVNVNRIAGGGGDVQSVTPLEYFNVGLGLNSESSSYPLKNRSFVAKFSPYHHQHHYHHVSETSADEVMIRASGKMLFTAKQWQELEMQTVIYNYIMASIPVPSQLLLPLSTQSNRVSMGFRFSNGSDPEPWRCRRTDGKKWRCLKDVAPDQKYCEHHTRKTRSRSRKPVETQSLNTKYYPAMLSAANRQSDNQWFMKNTGTSVYQSDHHWLNQASWACLGSGSGSTAGGPLGEALGPGITSTVNEPYSHGYNYSTTTTISSCDDGGLNFVNRHDD